MSRARPRLLEPFLWLLAAPPWWLSALFAVGSFAVMGALERAGEAAAAEPHGAGTLVWRALPVAARFGQFALPCLFAFGAALAIARKLRAAGEAALAPIGDSVGVPLPFTAPAAKAGALSRREFAVLAAEVYRRQGYRVEATSDREDGGVDIVLRRDGARYVVRCKALAAEPAKGSETDVLNVPAAHDHESAGPLDAPDGIVEDVGTLDAQPASVETRPQLGQGDRAVEKL